ncbi:Peptide transporter family 1 [Aphelenchoides besseyi]|nr:Peptide transporter family 1 [Aphelenchoides besseyi]
METTIRPRKDFTPTFIDAQDGQLQRRRKEKPKPAESWSEIFRAWPKITFCIVANEFCERFSFYGMKTVLTLYMLNVLKYNDAESTSFFNIFGACCYATSVIGCVLADGYIGKFKTIFWLSIVYAAGQIMLAFASTQHTGTALHPYLDLAGLAVVAIGTGGIKPCVSQFGGDQFEKHEAKMITIFFSVFYFSINAGSLISTFISPIFRSMTCMGLDSCYPLAFGVPAILMITATVIFIIGSFKYKKNPPESNVFKDVAVVVTNAITHRSNDKKSHWLDHALNRHDCSTNTTCQSLKRRRRDQTACSKKNFVDDVKSLFKLSVIFIPMPFYWMLYDQQASIWIIQALQMDCQLWGNVKLLPDQTQSLNAVLILVLILVFESIIYPIAEKCVRITALRKMTVGGFLAALSFVVTALVQFKVNETLPAIPPNGYAYVSVINTLPNCNVTVNIYGSKSTGITAASQSAINATAKSVDNWLKVQRGPEVQFQLNTTGSACPSNLPTDSKFNVTDGQIFFLHVNSMGVFMSSVKETKSTEGQGDHKIAIIAALNENFDGNFAICRTDGIKADDPHPCDPKQKANFYFYDSLVGKIEYGASGTYATVFQSASVRPGSWRLYYVLKNGDTAENIEVQSTGYEYSMKHEGGVYVLSLTGEMKTPTITVFQETPDNGMSILWQVPQIFIMTCAEILFSITGNEFAYTQAAPSMKSIVGAFWLLTTFFGDMMIVAITLIRFSDNMAIMFLINAAIMTVVIIIFMLISIFYFEYANYTGEDAEDSETESEYVDDESSLVVDKKDQLLDEHSWNTKL